MELNTLKGIAIKGHIELVTTVHCAETASIPSFNTVNAIQYTYAMQHPTSQNSTNSTNLPTNNDMQIPISG